MIGGGRRNADAGGDGEVPGTGGEGGAFIASARQAASASAAVGGGPSEQDRELVAAEPGHHVARPCAAAQAIGHLHQEPIAGGVTEAVVDDFEAVEIEE